MTVTAIIGGHAREERSACKRDGQDRRRHRSAKCRIRCAAEGVYQELKVSGSYLYSWLEQA